MVPQRGHHALTCETPEEARSTPALLNEAACSIVQALTAPLHVADALVYEVGRYFKVVRRNQDKYAFRVSRFAAGHFSSCSRIRILISFQIAESQTLKAGLRLGMTKGLMPASFLARAPFPDLKPVGSLSSRTAKCRFCPQALMKAVFKGFVCIEAAAPSFQRPYGTSCHIIMRPAPTAAMIKELCAPVLTLAFFFGLTYAPSSPWPGER